MLCGKEKMRNEYWVFEPQFFILAKLTILEQ